MAAGAGYGLMAAFEPEIRIFVVESRAIQDGDTGIPANMVGMTCFAGGLGNLRLQAVKALTREKISIGFLVAVETELGLCVLLETRVTTRTLALVFCVSLDQFARHQQGFNFSSACDVHEEKTHRGKQY